MRVADYIVQKIAESGVHTVFMVPGGGAMHLNDALGRCDRLRYICNLHEQASAVAAENYAKIVKGPGACLVTTGPGSTNALTGVVGAWQDSTPVVFVSGQVKRADSSRGLGVRCLGVQEVDIVGMVANCTKYAVTLNDPATVRYHVEKAFHLMRAGRPGPVWIDVPLDIQSSQIDPDSQQGYVPEKTAIGAASELSVKVAEMIRLLNRAERPVVLIGNGVRLAGAESEMFDMLERLGVPVLATWLAIDILHENHPLYIGRPGAVAPRGVNFALQNSDFLLSIGARLDLVITAFSHENFARGAKKVMVDIDPAEIGKMKTPIHLPIVADAGEFIRDVLAQQASIEAHSRTHWWERCREWKKKYPVVLLEHLEHKGRVSVYALAEAIGQELCGGEIVVSGSSGSGIEIFLHAFQVKPRQRVLHTTALGSMGFALPAVVGAGAASPGTTIVAVDGDGGFFFNIQELETIHRLNLPAKIFVLNNNGFSSIRNSQQYWFKDKLVAADETSGLTLPDIMRVSESFGLRVVRIESQDSLRMKVRDVLAMAGPVVCEVMVICDEARIPRVSSMQKDDGTFVSKPLEDLFPFLDREEFHANMIIPPLPE